MANDRRDTGYSAARKSSYDYVIVGGGAAGCVVASELSKTGAEVLLVESGGVDSAPTIGNPSVWFYNVGGALDWKLPIAPVPQLNHRKLNMAQVRLASADWRDVDLARTGSASFGHPVGTARMGTDAGAVVDPALRVHHVRGLRVADASVMPTIVAGATNAPTIMIGGRAATLINRSA